MPTTYKKVKADKNSDREVIVNSKDLNWGDNTSSFNTWYGNSVKNYDKSNFSMLPEFYKRSFGNNYAEGSPERNRILALQKQFKVKEDGLVGGETIQGALTFFDKHRQEVERYNREQAALDSGKSRAVGFTDKNGNFKSVADAQKEAAAIKATRPKTKYIMPANNQ